MSIDETGSSVYDFLSDPNDDMISHGLYLCLSLANCYTPILKWFDIPKYIWVF